MKKTLLITALLSTSLLSGCIVAVSDGEMEHSWASDYSNSDWKSVQKKNRENLAKLELGASYEQVLGMFNTPDFTELVKKSDGVYNVLYFATNSKHSDGKVTKDECTALVFKDKELIGFGESALKQIL